MLENYRLKLRAPEPEDLDTLYKWENDTSLWKLGPTLSPISKYTLKEYISQSHLSIFDIKQLRLIIILKSDQTPIGAIDLFDFDPFHQRVAIGILIDKEFHNQGYAKESINLIKDYCFNFLHLHQIYAQVHCSNNPSRNLFLNTGFKETGILKDWLKTENGYEDVYWMQCLHS